LIGHRHSGSDDFEEIEVDIERLLKKRQLNVQEQNALVAHRLMVTAKAWLARGIPLALKNHGESEGIRWSETVVLDLEVGFPGMPNLYGLLLVSVQPTHLPNSSIKGCGVHVLYPDAITP
jgi:hypothetical protein